MRLHSTSLGAAALLSSFAIGESQGNSGKISFDGAPKSSTAGGKVARKGKLSTATLNKGQLKKMERLTAQFMETEEAREFIQVQTEGEGWHGEAVDGLGELNMVYDETTDTLVGSAYNEDAVITFNTLPDGSVEATEILNSDFPEDPDPHEPQEPGSAVADAGRKLLTRGLRGIDQRELQTGKTIDIMILYTLSTMCEEAGFGDVTTCPNTAANRAPIEARARLAISETNTMFELSGVPTRFRLVFTGGVDYDDSGTFSWSAMLGHLRGASDGYLDHIHAWRDTYGADLVQMWVTTGGYCGLANMFTGSPEAAFGLDERTCTTGFFSFGHEAGHNMGLHHDRDTVGCGTSCSGYNYGWRDDALNMRTNMAYNCPNSCPKIQRFSNTYAQYNNVDVGSTTQNNAQVIMDNQDAVSNFRAAIATCSSDSDCSDNDVCTGTETCSNGVCYGGSLVMCDTQDKCKVPDCEPSNGQCSYSDLVCDDHDVCTSDSCDSSTGCVFTDIPGCTSGSLGTITSGSKYITNGHMFDLEAKVENLVVTGLEVYPYTDGQCTVEVYTRDGSFAGGVGSSAGWNLIQTATIVAKPWTSEPLPNFSSAESIPLGTKKGFYVTFDASCTMLFHGGDSAGGVDAEDDNLKVYEGRGVPHKFTSGWFPYVWNGVARYAIESAAPPSGPICGDGQCEQGEEISCPADCPSGPICGDGQCEKDAGEDGIQCPADCLTFQLELLTDNYGGETTWELEQGGSILLAGGPYPDRYNIPSVQTTVENIDTTFTIYDAWGDGICCAWGSGEYKVYVNGDLKHTGGAFQSSESISFTSDAFQVYASEASCENQADFSMKLKGVEYTCQDIKDDWALCDECQGNKCMRDACCACN